MPPLRIVRPTTLRIFVLGFTTTTAGSVSACVQSRWSPNLDHRLSGAVRRFRDHLGKRLGHQDLGDNSFRSRRLAFRFLMGHIVIPSQIVR